MARVTPKHGFTVCRVRHFGPRARIEVSPEEVTRFGDGALMADVTARFGAAGFKEPGGYRQSALNELARSGSVVRSPCIS